MAPELSIKDQNREVELFVGRATTLFVLVVLMLGLLIYRMLELQLWNHDTYKTRSDDNRIRVQTLAPPRGLIFDRNGRLLADNQNASSLAFVIDNMPEPFQSLERIGSLLELTNAQRSEMISRVESNRRPDAPLVVVDSLTEEQVARLAVNRHLLPGTEVVNRLVRHYPHAEIAAHAVGSVRRLSDEDLRRVDPVQYSATEFIGKRGVEAFYEDTLHGQVGYQKAESDALGRLRQTLDLQSPTPGKDQYLHLDIELQRAGVDALDGRRGAVVALDPRNGGVLAMVSQPAYDPNFFVTGMSEAVFGSLSTSKYSPLFNRATNGQYAPGSTFKPIVGLAGIGLSATMWDTVIEDRGAFQLPGQEREYRDWSWTKDNSGGQGMVDLRRAIYRSSNVYFYDLASRIPVQDLVDFAAQFGLGRDMSVDIHAAGSGLLPNPVWKQGAKGLPWFLGDSVNMGIGQGDLLATPLQMAVVAATLANRGRLVQPRMMRGIDSPESGDGESSRPSTQIALEQVSTQDWENMVAALEDVVHRGNQGFRGNGTAWAYIGQDIDYRMAGKSGTAQVVEISQGEEYDEEILSEFDRNHAWFIAFAPVENPTIALAVLVENGGGGSSVAAPVARAVIDAHMQKAESERVAQQEMLVQR
ncbi:MAG: penicillin-binding protein 2 [Pseudomonadota bacterium]|nr:penicillin-binding protein 2 [Pseudomonadota bacterium]